MNNNVIAESGYILMNAEGQFGSIALKMTHASTKEVLRFGPIHCATVFTEKNAWRLRIRDSEDRARAEKAIVAILPIKVTRLIEFVKGDK
jgi:hypothetical protein